MNGGYLMVSKSDTNLYTKLNNALTVGKPVLFYEDENTCYYIDAITKSGTDIVLTKGGKTITVESDGDITESGSTSAPTMENIKDLAGRLRFIEGNGTIINPTEDFNITQNKWSLSGTHLMVVLAGTIGNNVTYTGGYFTSFDMPQWILDKIYIVVNSIVELKQITLWNTGDLSDRDTVECSIDKVDGKIKLAFGNFTTDSIKSFRVQFDLLIDVE